MKFELYTGAWPKQELIGIFDDMTSAINHGEKYHPKEHMYINCGCQTVKIYTPYFKTWGYVNHK